jgi:hypothetical protein
MLRAEATEAMRAVIAAYETRIFAIVVLSPGQRKRMEEGQVLISAR